MAKEVIFEALQRPEPEREPFVRKRCEDDAVRAEILAVLKDYSTSDDFLASHPDDGDLEEPAELADLSPGTQLGHYIIVKRLGRGGMGQVFLANDQELQRDVALKCLLSSRRGPAAERARVLREARAAAAINHPNVATIYQVVEHGDRAFIEMEYVEGETLAARLKRELLPIDRAIAIGCQLAAALAAAHSRDIVHRDLKPANVQITPDGSVKVLDFGVAGVFAPSSIGSSKAATGVATFRGGGTPAYMSPEQLLGHHMDDRSDIYSLGVVLFEIVTGRRPYTSIDPLELVRAQEKGAPRADAIDLTVPGPLADVIAKLLEVDPADRYQSAREAKSALEEQERALKVPTQTRYDSAVTQILSAPAPTTTTAPANWRPVRARRKTRLMAAGLAAVSALTTGLWRVSSGRMSTTVSAPIRSIAVLPLLNVSGDPAQEYFVDGMTEELIGMLARLEGVSVISATSTMQFKGSKRPLPEIARAVHADAILEGSVLLLPGSSPAATRNDQRVRINARLIFAGTDTQLWERGFETVVADVLALQHDVAKAVADGIHLRLTSQKAGSVALASKNRTVNPQAYEAYLRGRYLWNKRTPEDLRNAIGEFRRAIDLDPTYPLAWAGLADGYRTLSIYDEASPRELMPQARAAATKALELDDSLAEARTSLAAISWTYDWDAEATERAFMQALADNPNYATAHELYSRYLNETGRFEEGLSEMRRAQELDPLSLVIQVNVARSYYWARDYDRALTLLQRLAQREPNYWIAHAVLGQMYLSTGQFDAAIRELEVARHLSPSILRNLGVLGDAYGRAGRRAEALKIDEQLSDASSRRYVPPMYRAMISIGLQDRPRTLAFLKQAYADRSDWMMQINVEPEFDAVRGDPEIRGLLPRMTPRPAQ
jgi:serine/threonine protein kinase/TolB-like protein/Tfp pilus assembly protein PilF